MSYPELVSEISTCRRCGLWRYRRNPVPGEGPLHADVMFVGEAPGRNEDEQGRPFVGAAGRLLTELIELLGISRAQVYITNVVKCRPPGNRDPEPEEVEACLPYLIRQIQIIKPKLLVALGRHAARTLYKLAGIEWRSMGQQHGRSVEACIGGVKLVLIATYHPAAALYNPGLRDELVKDFRDVIAPKVKEIVSSAGKLGPSQRKLTEFL